MSSSSSEDENYDLLREATDKQFINDDMYKENHVKKEEESLTKLQSLRPFKNEEEQFNLFRVTPEFRTHVAKRLSKLLDGKLEELLEESSTTNLAQRKRHKTGVKLFKSSQNYLKSTSKRNKEQRHPMVQREANNKKLQTYEELKNNHVAVTKQDLIKEVANWSKRTKSSRIFEYKHDKSVNKLILVKK